MDNKINGALPEIRISFSRLLYDGECRRLDLILNSGESKIASAEKLEAKTEEYRKEWAKYETVILRGMTEVLELSFYRPVIDVTLAPYFGNKSSPLIINFRPDPDRFVDVLTHELLHILQTDNNKHQALGPRPTVKLPAEWRKLFGQHERLTAVHIPLHAIHKYIFLDVLKAPERLEREISLLSNSQTGEAYIQAWEYVNKRNYMEIIEEVRKLYAFQKTYSPIHTAP
jgi:hypothetical protein